MRRESGFTMAELIMSIAVLAILSLSAASRFADVSFFRSASAADRAEYVLKIGRKAAMAQRRTIYAVQTGSLLGLCYSNANPCPSGQSVMFGGTAVSGDVGNYSIPAISFDSKGTAGATKISFAMGGRTITVEGGTGYVHS